MTQHEAAGMSVAMTQSTMRYALLCSPRSCQVRHAHAVPNPCGRTMISMLGTASTYVLTGGHVPIDSSTRSATAAAVTLRKGRAG